MFCNVDEEAHFDLVLKYSQGHVPKKFELISAEAAAVIAQNASPEYFMRPMDYPNEVFPAPYSRSDSTLTQLKLKRHYWHSIYNHESSSPPSYYSLAGTWLRAGLVFGFCKFDTKWMLIWIRLLNVILIFVLVLLTYRIASIVFANLEYAPITAALLVALLPQDAFYSIQSDVLSPVCFGACIYYLLRFVSLSQSSINGALSGLFLGATVLCKNGNLILFPTLIAVLLIYYFYKKSKGTSHLNWRALGYFISVSVIIVGLWVLRNKFYFGDWTATEEKASILGWKIKPLSKWLPHPLLTLTGVKAWSFELFASFWRGEFTWHRERITTAWLDQFYWLSTVFTTIGFFVLLIIKSITKKIELSHLVLFLSWTSLLLFIILLSMRYDFSECYYPSNEHPYFNSGRLISAGIIPFALMLVGVLNWIPPVKIAQKFVLVLIFSLLSYISWQEFQMSRAAMASHYSFLFEFLN